MGLNALLSFIGQSRKQIDAQFCFQVIDTNQADLQPALYLRLIWESKGQTTGVWRRS